jgi:hypothetical protein
LFMGNVVPAVAPSFNSGIGVRINVIVRKRTIYAFLRHFWLSYAIV